MKFHFLRRFGALMLSLAMLLTLVTVPALADGEGTESDGSEGPELKIFGSREALGDNTKYEEIVEQVADPNQKTSYYFALKVTADETDVTDQVTWSSEDSTIATVQNGFVTGVAPGSTYVTAEYGGKTAEILVHIVKISVSFTAQTIKVGETATATLTIDQGDDSTLVYDSPTWTLPTGVEPVGSTTGMSCEVKGVSASKSSLFFYSVTFKNQSSDKLLEVKVGEGFSVTDDGTTTDPEPEKPEESKDLSISLNQKSLSLKAGGTPGILTATVTPSGTPVVWTSSDEKVATVSGGTVTAVAAGTATITATVTANGETKTASCDVTVSWDPATKITINTSSLILSPGEDRVLTATVTPNSANPNLVWTSSDPTVATVDSTGRVHGVKAGEATITAASPDNPSMLDSLRVEVTGVRLNPTTVYLMVGRSEQMGWELFGSARNQTTGSGTWTTSDPNVAYISSSSNKITGRAVGTATVTFTYIVGNTRYTDTCLVTVSENTVGMVTGTAQAGVPFQLSTLGASLDQVCREAKSTLDNDGNTVLGPGLSYITNLSVSPSEGVLYYNFVSTNDTGAGVAAGEIYYYTGGGSGARNISSLTFLPNRGLSGTATISYTGYNTSGESYAGTIRLTISGTDDVTYTISKGETVTLDATDFDAICQAHTGRSLASVSFTLPAASQGALYYGYTSPGQYTTTVSGSTQYFRSRSPYLSQITYVPPEDYVGTLRINYQATDSANGTYSGQMTIIVTDSSVTETEDDNLTCTVAQGNRVSFSVFSLNAACLEALGESLSYIRINALPSSSQGTLYYNYRSSTSYGSLVGVNTRYYLYGTPYISYISFVPAFNAAGTVTIPFTGYTSTSSRRFDGTLTIIYSENTSGGAISYVIDAGKTALFEAADFNERCTDATGSPLNYIRFETLPSASDGTLFYYYNSVSGSGTRVTTTTNYYRTSLSQITFVPASGFSGTVSLRYTGTSTAGTTYTGTVEIEVQAKTAVPIYYTGTSLPISLYASDFYQSCRTVLDGTLSYVQFTSISTTAGRLYYNYSGYGTGSQASTSTRYYYSGSPNLSQLTYLPKADYTGTTTLRYNAVSTTGDVASGTVLITVTNNGVSVFNDMSSYRWAIPSVNFLYNCGVTEGMNATQYGPGQYIRRCDFVLMLCRTFGFTSTSTSNFSDVPAGSYYASAVATAKALGIAQGDNGRFMPTSPLTRQDAMVMLYRAMTAAGWSMPNGATANLAAYTDNSLISSYARNAIGSMVLLGIVTGDGGRLMPTSNITRAEMAVILHRAMTL